MKLASIIQKHVRNRFVTRKELKATSDQEWSWLPRMRSEVEFKSGVYAVFFWSDTRRKWYVYVGQSQNIGHRLKFHCAVEKRAYPNRKYMNIAKKYAPSVRVRVLESCAPDDMPRVEQKWLKHSEAHVESQMILNMRVDNVETNRGVPNKWVKEQWRSNPAYRKKMRAALRRGSEKASSNPENRALRKRVIQQNTEDREERRHSSPYEAAVFTMNTSKPKGVDPVKVSGWCFGSYSHLAKAMRCSRRIATSGWKRGELYGFKLEQVTWKEYLKFFKDAKTFTCEELRKPMSNSQAASSLWKGIAGTAQPLVAKSPDGDKFYFRGKKPCGRSIDVPWPMITLSMKHDVPFHGWVFRPLPVAKAMKHIDEINPDLGIKYTYGEKQMRTKRFLKELNTP